MENAERVRFNIETKINPRGDIDPQGIKFSDRTVDPETFARAVARVIIKNGMLDRADIQSFDFRTLLIVQQKFPRSGRCISSAIFRFLPIRISGSDDGTNLQDEDGENTPWLAGMFWPYRSTALSNSIPRSEKRRVRRHGIDQRPKEIAPAARATLTGSDPKTLLIHEFDIESRSIPGSVTSTRLIHRAPTLATSSCTTISTVSSSSVIIPRVI